MKALKSINLDLVSKNLSVQPENISEYYDISDVTKDILDYIKAIKNRSMFCIIDSVSNSGMSRVLSYKAAQRNKSREYNYRQFAFMFKAFGYKETKKYSGLFRISGCGMDMNFHTNYEIIHTIYRMKIINKKELEILSQRTPTCF